LAAGQIRFVPTLPVPLLEAIEACRLGCVEKIWFRLDKPLDEAGDGTWMSFMDKDSDGPLHPFQFYVNPFGRPLLVAYVGGTFGRELIMAGDKEAISFATEVLVKCLGSDFPRRITGATATSWITDPYIRGSFSFDRPGKTELRARLAEPVGERLFFAGEAVSPNFYATAHGAHLTGIAAAERALRIV
jgi:monoamine oxidase